MNNLNEIERLRKENEELKSTITSLHDSLNEECKRSDELEAKVNKQSEEIKYLRNGDRILDLESKVKELSEKLKGQTEAFNEQCDLTIQAQEMGSAYCDHAKSLDSKMKELEEALFRTASQAGSAMAVANHLDRVNKSLESQLTAQSEVIEKAKKYTIVMGTPESFEYVKACEALSAISSLRKETGKDL